MGKVINLLGEEQVDDTKTTYKEVLQAILDGDIIAREEFDTEIAGLIMIALPIDKDLAPTIHQYLVQENVDLLTIIGLLDYAKQVLLTYLINEVTLEQK